MKGEFSMEIINNEIQLLPSGKNVIFNQTIIPGNQAIIHTPGSGLVKLRGLTSCQCRARFKVFFNGNIAVPTAGTAGEISLAITLDDEPIGSATMISTPGDKNEFNNVSASIYIDVPAGCCSTVGVRNTSTQTISVQNANLIVERVA